MLNGATASATNENTSVIDAFTFVPIAIRTSRGIPYNSEYFGSRYHALRSIPAITSITPPAISEIIAIFLVFLV